MFAIIDYNQKATEELAKYLKKMNWTCTEASTSEELTGVEGIILPDATSFEEAMNYLTTYDMVKDIKKMVKDGKPILGIGMGMNLLMEASVEKGYISGLGLLEGMAEPLVEEPLFPSPRQGLGELICVLEDSDLTQLVKNQSVFFNQRLTVDCEIEDIVALSSYNYKLPSIVQHGNVTGFQFLPEKSKEIGHELLHYFLVKGGK